MQYGKPLVARIRFIDGKIRGGAYPTARVLAREYEVSERTIHRDIDYMRDMLDCPIEYDPARRGYYYTEPAFILPNVTISESELFSLCVAEKAMEQYRGTPLYGTLASIFSKILSSLPGEATVHYSWLNPDITFIQQSYTFIKHEIWEAISTALYTGTSLNIIHRKAGAKDSTERIVNPYHMVSYEGEWYLVAFCTMRRRVLIFAISRIEACERREENFIRPESFDLREYLGENFGITVGGKVFDVEIEFMPGAAPYIRERVWREGQTLDELPSGGLILSFAANSLDEVKRWVLGWGPMARVRAPEALVDEIMRDLRSAAGNYIDREGAGT